MAALRAIMKTTAARLSALYLILFAISATLLVFYMTSLSVHMLERQVQDTITEDVQRLALGYERGGLPLLVRAVELRSRQPGANLYLLASPSWKGLKLGRITDVIRCTTSIGRQP